MKFKEEVLAKIFTYITVLVLLGIVIFEAYTLQNERGRRREIEEKESAAQESLQQMISLNAGLQEEKDALQEFQDEWAPYAAFVDSKEVLSLKDDLFSRPDLIPGEAADAYEEAKNAVREEEEGQADSKKENKEKNEGQKEAEQKAVFTFDNPDGEDVFLPLSTGFAGDGSCLIYTAAYENEGDGVMELLYEVTFTSQGSKTALDENGEVIWSCIAYDFGSGWTGMDRGEEAEQ